ncbi:hypothetical protein [Nocardia brasiliensis]|uniref:hypothetical protein n=1 Tax=Nocardia brasiliensis TaxID=37326 RepID=UPI0024544967|nr:hypothetical protein [Nocardia brasiliensis]
MTQSPSASHAQRVAETKKQSTAALATALETLCAVGPLDDTEYSISGVIIDTLCDRHLHVAAAYNAWIANLESADSAEAVVARAAREVCDRDSL